MCLLLLHIGAENKAASIEESIKHAREAVMLDIKDGNSWCKVPFSNKIKYHSNYIYLSIHSDIYILLFPTLDQKVVRSPDLMSLESFP